MLRPAAIAFAMLTSCETGDAATCFGVCGEGTRCESGRCIVATPVAEAEPAAPESKIGKRGRRRPGSPSEDPVDGAPSYQSIADGHIPKYDANADTVLDPDAGSERLADAVVRAELRGLEPALNRCIADAAKAGVTVGSGRVEIVLGLTAKGKVSGVTAKAPAAIKDSGVVSCLRKVVFDHRFPAYDGPPMGVDYTFDVE